MITILGGGIVGAALARALAIRGRGDEVVFDPRPPVLATCDIYSRKQQFA